MSAKLETRKEAIIVAAACLFTRHGYADVSMDRIADTANVSKATVYKKFSCKEEVFRASVEFLAHKHCPSPPSLDLDGGALHVLRALAVWLRETGWSPDFIEFCHLCLSQARQFPDVTQYGYSYMMVPLIAPCEGAFQQMGEAGLLHLPDSQLAAEQFFGLVVGLQLWRQLFGAAPSDREPFDKTVDQIVEMFMRAYSPPLE